MNADIAVKPSIFEEVLKLRAVESWPEGGGESRVRKGLRRGAWAGPDSEGWRLVRLTCP